MVPTELRVNRGQMRMLLSCKRQLVRLPLPGAPLGARKHACGRVKCKAGNTQGGEKDEKNVRPPVAIHSPLWFSKNHGPGPGLPKSPHSDHSVQSTPVHCTWPHSNVEARIISTSLGGRRVGTPRGANGTHPANGTASLNPVT